jgi:L-lactate dehydrogenase complex protein LldG
MTTDDAARRAGGDGGDGRGTGGRGGDGGGSEERGTGSREVIMARIRAALADVPEDETPEDVPVPRDYRDSHTGADPAALLDLLHENLADYRAKVHRSTTGELPATLARLLTERGARTVAVPAGLSAAWLAALPEGIQQVVESPTLTARQLDLVDSVVTGCALAVAETGTLVLDAGPGQGRRALTLVPDHHVCVVQAPGQVVASLPQAMPRLDPSRPLTWISGPSATSDIELDRVEGVHGPRMLDVVLVVD